MGRGTFGESYAPKAKVRVVQEQPATPPVYEGQYIPPPQRAPGSGWQKGAGGAAVGLALLLAKFKTLAFSLLYFKSFFFSALSLLVSVWFYALFWGWRFALVFVLLILVHELGHALFMRMLGIPASMPYFIPGMGALIALKGRPASALYEAYIALGGPLMGTVGALGCFLYGQATGSNFWIACAYTGFFLNLFNLFPTLPLDGGRIAGAISPRIWIFGLIAIVVAAIAFHWWNPLILILIVLSFPQAIAAWRGKIDTRYYALTASQRGGVAFSYFALAAFLFAFMLESHVGVPRPAIS